MRKVTSLQLPLRRVVPLAIIVVGLIVISALVIQQVSAQASRTLKPPFKLIQTDRTTQRPTDLLPPLDAPIVMSQTFDSRLSAGDQPRPTGLARIGGQRCHQRLHLEIRRYRAVHGYGLVGWPQSIGLSDLLNPATDTYTNGMEAVLVYGPLDMSDYAQAVFTMTYWLDTAPGDYVGVAVSTDGSNFTAANTESIADPTLATTRTLTLSLSPYIVRQPTVWIAVYLKSDAALPVGRGMFVHEAVLRGVPFSKDYMPLVLNNYPPATPTPTPTLTPTPTATPTATPQVAYRYQYTFTSESNGNNPDFNRWGVIARPVVAPIVITIKTWLPRLERKPGNSFKLWLQGVNGNGGAGPRQNGVSLSTATNFEYSADLFVYNGQLDAALWPGVRRPRQSTFPDSGTPLVRIPSIITNYWNCDGVQVTAPKWHSVAVCPSEEWRPTVELTTWPTSQDPHQGQWHNVKVMLQGTTMTFYLNNQLDWLGIHRCRWDTRSSPVWPLHPNARFQWHGGPFEFFSDNITVRDLP